MLSASQTPFIRLLKSAETAVSGSLYSNIGSGARLFTGIRLISSFAFSIAALSSSHTAAAIPFAAASEAEPEFSFVNAGVIKNSASLVIIMKSDEQANRAALPAHVPATTEI